MIFPELFEYSTLRFVIFTGELSIHDENPVVFRTSAPSTPAGRAPRRKTGRNLRPMVIVAGVKPVVPVV